MERQQQTLNNLERLLYHLRWGPCLLGLITGCVCTSVIALSIGLIAHPCFGAHSKDPHETTDFVDGGWSNWEQLGSCSVTCGQGVIPIVRRCDSPAPMYSGKNCVGEHYGLGICSMAPCPESNIALKKETTQSSVAEEYNLFSHFAVDGILCQEEWRKCTHTRKEYNAWWAVDLGGVFNITNMLLYGRTDCCTDRLSNFDIDVFRPKTNQVLQLSNFQQGINSRCHYQPGGLPQNQMLNVTCTPGTYGRYVRIRLRGDNPMTLCEVEIFGAQTLTLFGTENIKYGEPYDGAGIRTIDGLKEEECINFCGTDACQSDCVASYLPQQNTCIIANITESKNES